MGKHSQEEWHDHVMALLRHGMARCRHCDSLLSDGTGRVAQTAVETYAVCSPYCRDPVTGRLIDPRGSEV